jgi:hypothetical protein
MPVVLFPLPLPLLAAREAAMAVGCEGGEINDVDDNGRGAAGTTGWPRPTSGTCGGVVFSIVGTFLINKNILCC